MSDELQPANPPVNVYEGREQLSVAVPVPGAHPDHTSILLSSKRLRLEAVCKYPQESQHFLRRDWTVGTWRLDLELPRSVDPSRARATLNLGVLVVMAPLSEGVEGEHPVAIVKEHLTAGPGVG